MKKKMIFFLAVSMFFMGNIFASNAQEANNKQSLPGGVVMIADVNIYNAKIDSQDKNNINISFELSNGKGVQPSVGYSVELAKKDGENMILVDRKVYPELISLSENTKIQKNINYVAPEYLKGEFEVWLVSKNESGLTLSVVKAGDVTLEGDIQYVNIISESCYLTVFGEEGEKKYTLVQGVDIKDTEKIILYCDVENNFTKNISVLPKFETFFRSSFGEKVEDNKEVQSLISLNAGEKRQISFTLPKALKPQAYDVRLGLSESGEGLVSNLLDVHYVLRGNSATINNLQLDKDSYIKDENAKVMFVFSPPADNFPGARHGYNPGGKFFSSISIKNNKGQECALFEQELDINSSVNNYEVEIKKDCIDPIVTALIKDVNGNVLDKKEFAIKSSTNKPTQKEVAIEKNEFDGKLLVALLIFVIIGIIIFVIIRNKKGMSLFAITIAFLGMAYFSSPEASATTYNVQIPLEPGQAPVWWDDPATTGTTQDVWVTHRGNMQITTGLNRTVYAPSETIKASMAIALTSCANVGIYGYAGIRHQTGVYESGDWGEGMIAGGMNVSLDLDFVAPSNPGSYNMIFGILFSSMYLDYNHDGIYNDYVTDVSSYFTGNTGTPGLYEAPEPYMVGKNCTTPWGEVVSHGTAKSAFNTSGGTLCGGGCLNQQRYCDDGTWKNGASVSPFTYTLQSCPSCACISVPANSTLFSGTNTSVTSNTTSVYSATDTAIKCQYYCNSGYTYSGGSCIPIAYSCTGLPSNATLYTGVNTTLSANTASIYSATDTIAKCEYSCNSGYEYSAGTCIASCGAWSPDPSTVCLGQSFIQSNGCSTQPAIGTNSSLCTTYSCTAPPANAALYTGVNTTVSANTTSVYSASDTPAKCEYSCNAGYGPSGSSCVPLSTSVDIYTTSENPIALASSSDTLPKDVNLSWTVLGTAPAYCTATNSITSPEWSGNKSIAGGSDNSITIPPGTSSVTYTLTCYNSSGTQIATDSQPFSIGCYKGTCSGVTCNSVFSPTSVYNCSGGCTSNAMCATGSSNIGGYREVAP